MEIHKITFLNSRFQVEYFFKIFRFAVSYQNIQDITEGPDTKKLENVCINICPETFNLRVITEREHL